MTYIQIVCINNKSLVRCINWLTMETIHVLYSGTECAKHIQIIITYAQEAYDVIPNQVLSWFNPKYHMVTGLIKTAGNIGI